MQILFNHQSSDGNTEVGTETTVLHIYGNSDLRFVHRCEAHEHRVVATAVLGRTGLTADNDVATVQVLTGTTQYRSTHTLYDIFVGRTIGHGEMLLGELLLQRFILYLAHHMRRDEIAAVGNGGTQVGDLQRRERYLTLTDGDTDHTQSAPPFRQILVVIFGIRNHTTFLTGQVDAEGIAEAHALHIVAPGIHRLLHILVLLSVTQHVVETPAEIAVARGTDGGY